MLIIDKQDDVKILLDMGATPRVVRQIFLFEGWLIAIVGAVMGVLLGLLLCYLQCSFGLITLGSGQGFVIQAYPVRVVWSDVLIIFSTVVIMGFFAAVYPSKYFYSHK
jgi:ABC-type lipoprotein release transport system permease subunit